jgi:predicted TIM-barrel fold metal-dependent hydrolase
MTPEKAMIDTHQHLIYRELFRYDWTAPFPVLHGEFSLGDYRAAAAGCGITETVFMEVDVAFEHAAAESAHFCSLADDPANGITGVIAACRPEEPGIDSWIESLFHPRLVGFRRILHTQPDDLCISRQFRDNVARIGMAGLTFDLCMLPQQLANGTMLVDACPDTVFILDHCGVPDIASGDLGFWREQLREISRRPNLNCKISGIIAYAAGDITAATLRPVVEHCIECFGWERVMWGGDWPVCNLTGDLACWKSMLDEILAGCSDNERKKLDARNARRIYQLNSHLDS